MVPFVGCRVSYQRETTIRVQCGPVFMFTLHHCKLTSKEAKQKKRRFSVCCCLFVVRSKIVVISLDFIGIIQFKFSAPTRHEIFGWLPFLIF